MKKVFFGFFAALIALAFTACSDIMAEQDMATVDGEVFYLQRIALPDNAKLTVTLADVSLADAPMEVISSQSYVTEGKQVPLPFSLSYSPSEIKPGHTYNVSARIEVNGELVFISDTAHSVINDPAATQNIKVQVVSAAR
ncbi:lipoprotein-related protein [Enterovibrio norvegicus]|uniref:YbaY family lipoprotein n=2 Tax=Enterovibrio norvegicus TaxID=188144 RepID=A0ABV4L7V9_9GAMM|nr:YbaY family lipoprotein [Enterovibrio norvegicus]MCC4800273.1 YbaY family lipoprotein [Enterovibrio norvegicus]OEE50806.1 lipoprotein-related protein [Enterovibrio norvegicus]OEF48736.1 lipoprotein-related protein [Enterovibrio norvegicus]OEF55145.1 lipoprotein-related protein [Enterovibrio norvegicus]PMH60082.1 lipoprotein-related protein [Enterovibrio norvegicus]